LPTLQACEGFRLSTFRSSSSLRQHQQYVWALKLARIYYGQSAKRNYWNGCSTGGRQDLDLAEKHGEDFDGFVVGAPATYLSEFALAKAWPRPLCPWPKTAIYNGSGPTTEASSYHCGGDLDAWPPSKDTNNVATVCVGLHTRYQHETSDDLNYAEQGISPDQCPGPDHRH
jgi:hypothetical protein